MRPLTLNRLLKLQGVSLHSGTDAAIFVALEHTSGISLPEEHRALLEVSNGIEVYGGYVRLFGVNSTENTDSIVWNAADCWKFAWEDRCSAYWCFAETVWGDQYAYRRDSLCTKERHEVYFLDALSMAPQVVASSFEDFFETEFIRSAADPYDETIKKVRQKLGDIDAGSHLVYVPSILLGGKEDLANIQKMSARSAMI